MVRAMRITLVVVLMLPTMLNGSATTTLEHSWLRPKRRKLR
jgi:hypothetical protein